MEVPRSAMIAQAMTVLPDPGGATSTPSSWISITPTATAWSGLSSAVNATSTSTPGFLTSTKASREPARSTIPVTMGRNPRGSTKWSSTVMS
jgi:hypothetical protein